MKVIEAEGMGLCFGVRDALAVIDNVPDPARVTIHGELVHNDAVTGDLAERGFRMTAEADRSNTPSTDTVLITAHGVSNRERHWLQLSGKNLIDTTCPLVARAHQAAADLAAEGRHVLIIGKRGHVEVQGIIEDLDCYEVIEQVDEVGPYRAKRLGVLCQTTTPGRLVCMVLDAVRVHNPDADIRFIDTVCHPTKQHQQALTRLLPQVDAMVVVGGRNSNNTRELVNLCRDSKVPAYHVQDATDLVPEWFAGCRTIGLTAGTSTLDATIAEVRQALSAMN